MELDSSEVWLLAADLGNAPLEVQAGAVQAITENTRLTTRDAKHFAPIRTGFLRDNIEGEAAGLVGYVTSNARYGIYVEHGTSDTPAQPYMRPAAELASQRLVDDLGDVGEDIL